MRYLVMLVVVLAGCAHGSGGTTSASESSSSASSSTSSSSSSGAPDAGRMQVPCVPLNSIDIWAPVGPEPSVSQAGTLLACMNGGSHTKAELDASGYIFPAGASENGIDVYGIQ